MVGGVVWWWKSKQKLLVSSAEVNENQLKNINFKPHKIPSRWKKEPEMRKMSEKILLLFGSENGIIQFAAKCDGIYDQQEKASAIQSEF